MSPLGRHRLVSSFMRWARRLRPVRPPSFPSWDLSVVLKGLLEPPFEPLESAPMRILLVTLLLALASFKRVGDLQALSVSESCTRFVPGRVKAFLRPRPGYVPKVLSTSFRSQVVVLQAFSSSPSSEDDDLRLLFPVRALKMYVDRSSQWQNKHLILPYSAHSQLINQWLGFKKHNYSLVHLRSGYDILKTNFSSNYQEEFLHCHPRVGYTPAPITERQTWCSLHLDGCVYGRKKINLPHYTVYIIFAREKINTYVKKGNKKNK